MSVKPCSLRPKPTCSPPSPTESTETGSRVKGAQERNKPPPPHPRLPAAAFLRRKISSPGEGRASRDAFPSGRLPALPARRHRAAFSSPPPPRDIF